MIKKPFFLSLLFGLTLSGYAFQAQANDLDAGSYLSSRFAQAHHDWVNASGFLDKVTQSALSNEELRVRSMILAMGSGDAKKAFEVAKEFERQDTVNSIVSIFLIVDAFDRKDYERASVILKSAPADPTLQFIGPFIHAWLQAAQGKVELSALRGNTIQLYHGILISDFLGDYSAVEKIIDKALRVEDINYTEVERIADLYGHVGLQAKALTLYDKVLQETTDQSAIQDKIDRLKSGKIEPLFKNIETVHDGMAQAFHDIANILSNENNDESARVFAHIALHLAPNKSETKFLLGDISARHKLFDDAISHYKSIGIDDDLYIKAQHKVVDIYEETDRHTQALAMLETLSKKDDSVDTIIKKGDIYRSKDNFKQALLAYDKAVQALGGKVTEEYWHLHYVRGISYEQSDNWEKAETELKAALLYQPDHPYVLNYLGYAWADQGIHLDEARAMIQKAVDLRPSDGYITDSLGWVMFRMGDYKGAVHWLEKAVELLPYDPTVNDHLGDAYWKVGRRLEARFQWERAKNYADDSEQIHAIEKKLVSGITSDNNMTSH